MPQLRTTLTLHNKSMPKYTFYAKDIKYNGIENIMEKSYKKKFSNIYFWTFNFFILISE